MKRNIIFSFCLLLTFAFCGLRNNNVNLSSNDSEKGTSSKPCEIGYIDESFKSSFYPFNFEYFNSKRILSHFASNIIVDSIEKTGYNDYKYRLYRFRDNFSFIEFMVKSYDSSEKWFYIEKGEIASNFLKFKNGISIGMTKEKFSKTLKINSFSCDTFEVSDGELATHYYFTFKENVLKKIIIYSEE